MEKNFSLKRLVRYNDLIYFVFESTDEDCLIYNYKGTDIIKDSLKIGNAYTFPKDISKKSFTLSSTIFRTLDDESKKEFNSIISNLYVFSNQFDNGDEVSLLYKNITNKKDEYRKKAKKSLSKNLDEYKIIYLDKTNFDSFKNSNTDYIFD